MARDAGYDDARPDPQSVLRQAPALIAQPTGTADVRLAVEFAREHSLLVAVKCGGHSLSGQSTCDRGLQIDLSLFRGVRVNPAARTAWVTGGRLPGQVDHEAMAHRLVTPPGTVSHAGVGGLVLGGGFGRVARRFGLSIDHLVGVEIVTADGRVLRASATENDDLYWGVRGGGGNFGIVTGFAFRLHPMERQVLGGRVVFPLARARDVLDVFAEYGATAPDDLYFDPFLTLPPAGAPGVAGLSVCYSGPANRADQVLAPLRKLGTALADELKAMDYTASSPACRPTSPPPSSTGRRPARAPPSSSSSTAAEPSAASPRTPPPFPSERPTPTCSPPSAGGWATIPPSTCRGSRGTGRRSSDSRPWQGAPIGRTSYQTFVEPQPSRKAPYLPRPAARRGRSAWPARGARPAAAPCRARRP